VKKVLFFVVIFTVIFLSINSLFHTKPNIEPAPELPIPIPTPEPTPQNFTEIIRGDTSKKQVIFTFDGGSTAESGDKILEVLKRHNVRGTFFLTGKFVETFPDLVKHIAKDKHEIFNHTYSHPHLPTLTDEQITGELDKMEDLLLKVASVSSKPYFRAPFGDRNSHVLTVAEKAGYRSVYWTVDALDWREGETPLHVRNRILSGVKPGTIYLMHIGDAVTGNILDEIFTDIEKMGYIIVPLTEGIL
jgi:peptidoglycan/xylan/chitin deacetylase (PgdA/CDA1 family)